MAGALRRMFGISEGSRVLQFASIGFDASVADIFTTLSTGATLSVHGRDTSSGEMSLTDPNPSPFVEFWTFSHPSVSSRAAFAAAYNPWIEGKHPKYFAK